MANPDLQARFASLAARVANSPPPAEEDERPSLSEPEPAPRPRPRPQRAPALPVGVESAESIYKSLMSRVEREGAPSRDTYSAPQQRYERRAPKPQFYDRNAPRPKPAAGAVDPADVFSYLRQKGVPDAHAVGMLNNIHHESAFKADINEAAPLVAGSRGGYGLFQHTGTRRKQLEAYARSVGKPVSDWQVQIDFALQEEDTRKYLSKQFNSPAEASRTFTIEWERPQFKEKKASQRLSTLGQYSALMGMPAEQAVSQMQGGPINRQDAMARMAELAAKHRPQQPEPAAAPEEEGGPSFNLARGAGERAADLAGGALEFAGDVGRNLDEAVSLGGITWEGMLPEYRGPKAYAEYMAGKTDWLQQGADAAKAVDLGYEPNVTWEDVKGSVAEGPRDFFKNLGGFAIEQFVVSSPDMLAVMANLPAYVVARSGELSQARAEADGKEQPETGDILIGTTAAVVSAAAERLGLDRLIKGLKGSREGLTKAELKVLDNVNEVVGAALVVGTAEGATEAIQEAVEYVAVQVGTEEGANLADLADSMLAGVAGGGTIGAGVGAAGAAAKQVREGNLPEVAAERAKQVREQIKTRMAGAQPGPQPGPQPAAQPGPQPAAQPGPQAGPQTQDQTAVNEVASGKRPAARVTDLMLSRRRKNTGWWSAARTKARSLRRKTMKAWWKLRGTRARWTTC